MKRRFAATKILFFIPTLFLFSIATAQLYTPANAHAHNDYLNKAPFYLAFQNGFGSIEADVFPVEGELLVAHYKKDVQPEKNLVNLYLNPLIRKLAEHKGRKLNLLIDIKENYKEALTLLISQLNPLQSYLSTVEKENYITIIISGDRPPPSEYKEYPFYIFFDDDLQRAHNAEEWKRVALVSLPFNKITSWKGEGDLNAGDEKKLAHIIDSTHSAGKPIRFWAAPDTETSWKLQMKLKADLIGTDKVNELAEFLKKKSKKRK
jgi:alkaline phosphatase